jgi:hypothetical protein
MKAQKNSIIMSLLGVRRRGVIKAATPSLYPRYVDGLRVFKLFVNCNNRADVTGRSRERGYSSTEHLTCK